MIKLKSYREKISCDIFGDEFWPMAHRKLEISICEYRKYELSTAVLNGKRTHVLAV